MVSSRSNNSSIMNKALAVSTVLAVVGSTSTANAQLSAIPKRYRSTKTQQISSAGSMNKRQLQEHQQQKKQGNLRTRNLEGSSMPSIELSELSVPLEESELSMPIVESEMSMPLTMFDMSIPLMEAELELSMPSVDLPSDSAGEEADIVTLENGSSSGSTLILASFLAGVSALVVAATAMFIKMRKVHSKECMENGDADTMEGQQAAPTIGQIMMSQKHPVVSFASHDEINDFSEGENAHEITLY